MPITRIRYNKTVNNTLSSKEILLNHDTVVITLNPMNTSFVVTDSKGLVVSQGTTNTMSNLKKIVKNELKKLGMVFGDEVRKKKIAHLNG